jgi:hypothetical protein
MSFFAASGGQQKYLLSGLFDENAVHSRSIAREKKKKNGANELHPRDC